MSGLGGMLGGRLKSAKKGRRAKQDAANTSMNLDMGRMASASEDPGSDGVTSPMADAEPRQPSLGKQPASSPPSEGSAAPKVKKGIWQDDDRKKTSALKTAESVAEEERRFQASAKPVDDILDSIPVIPDSEEPEVGSSKAEGDIAAPPSAAAARLDTYRVLDKEFVSQQVSWKVGGMDMSVLANAVMLPRSECCQESKPQDWDSLFTAVKSELESSQVSSETSTPSHQ